MLIFKWRLHFIFTINRWRNKMIPCWKAIKVQYQQKNKSHLHRQVLLLRVVLITRLAWMLKIGFFQPSMYSLNPPWPTHLRFSTLECSITDKRQWITYKEIKGNYWDTVYLVVSMQAKYPSLSCLALLWGCRNPKILLGKTHKRRSH